MRGLRYTEDDGNHYRTHNDRTRGNNHGTCDDGSTKDYCGRRGLQDEDTVRQFGWRCYLAHHAGNLRYDEEGLRRKAGL